MKKRKKNRFTLFCLHAFFEYVIIPLFRIFFKLQNLGYIFFFYSPCTLSGLNHQVEITDTMYLYSFFLKEFICFVEAISHIADESQQLQAFVLNSFYCFHTTPTGRNMIFY